MRSATTTVALSLLVFGSCAFACAYSPSPDGAALVREPTLPEEEETSSTPIKPSSQDNDPGIEVDDAGVTDAGTAGDSGAGQDGGVQQDSGVTDSGVQQDSGTGQPSQPSATKKVKDLTGPGTSAKPYGVGGTDLGIPVRQPNGKIAYLFGDTFDADGFGGAGFRSPVLLRSEPGNLAAGINFNDVAGGTVAKQILSYQPNTSGWSSWVPTDAITIGHRMYLHYVVKQANGSAAWSQIAYSDDEGENWSLSTTRFEANEDNSLRQLWTWERGTDGYVYVISTKYLTRDQPIIMYRVPETKLLEKAAYEPWGYKNDAWAWGNPATPILSGGFGELSLRRIEGKWVLSWFNAPEYNITIKVFDSPTSNLFTAKTYKPIKGGSWGAENDTTVAQLFGGYIHPDSTLHDLHLIVSQWNTGATNGWPYRAMQFVTGVE